MQDHKAEAILFETLVTLFHGDEEKAYKLYSEALLKLDISLPFNSNIYELSALSGFKQSELLEAYNKVRAAFDAYTFDYTILTPSDELFPQRLLTSEYPVRFLYLVGDKELLRKKKVGLLGMHLPSLQGKDDTLKLLSEVKEADEVLMTTLDIGIPSFGLSVADKLDLKAILVLQTPLHQCSPQSELERMVKVGNEGGLLVTRFAPSRRSEKWYAVLRNRLFVELVSMLLLVEEKDGGPGWSLATLIREDGRDIILPQLFVDNVNYSWAGKTQGLNHAVVYKKKGDLAKRLKNKKKGEKKEQKADDSYVQLSLF